MSNTIVSARERLTEATDAHVEFLADLGQRFLDGDLTWLPAADLTALTQRGRRLAKEREAAASGYMTAAASAAPAEAVAS